MLTYYNVYPITDPTPRRAIDENSPNIVTPFGRVKSAPSIIFVVHAE